MESQTILERARHFLQLEAQAILDTAKSVNDRFVAVISAVQTTADHGNKLVLAGLGKNAGVCQKLVGTFNSIGVSSTFLDPVQAFHGDLGVCRNGDLAFVLSNSGETREVLELIPLIQRQGVKTVAVTSEEESGLASSCDLLLTYQVNEEACPLNLAPTASTTATLALLDAVAMVFMESRKFTREHFARLHPSGSLGTTLLLHVEEIMRQGDRFASVQSNQSVSESIMEMTRAKAGSVAIVDSKDELAGIFTDADLRRATLVDPDVFSKPIDEFMTKDPITVEKGTLVADALKVFEESKIDDLLVVDPQNKPVGMIDSQDLPRLRVI